MTAPGKFSHRQYRQDIHIQHYDMDYLNEILFRSHNSQDARQIMSMFFENQADDFSKHPEVLSKESLKNIDDAIAGQRPDLAPAMWKMIFQRAKRSRVKISKLDIQLIEAAGVDLATLILIAQTGYVAKPYRNKMMTIINHDGSSKFILNKYDNVFQVDMYRMGQSVMWCQPCLRVNNMPDTAMSAVEGKSLTTLLSHPLLDPLNLSIKAVDPFDSESHNVLVETNYNPGYVLIAAMAQRKLEELDAA